MLPDHSRRACILKGVVMADTTRPWPERRICPYEKAMLLSRGLVTQEAGRRR